MSFRFKQFRIADNQCAMKVGTDGVLLGSWVSVDSVQSVLDIGTGSGLVALMIAQRTPSNTRIIGVEIEENAAQQAAENFKESPWKERIHVVCKDFKQYPETSDRFDLIVSNPPYFSKSLAPRSQTSQLARHDDSLSLNELIDKAVQLLSPIGRIALVLPYESETAVLELSHKNALSLSRTTYVKGTSSGKIKRILVELSRESKEKSSEELVLEQERHCYTQAYKELTKEFYL